MSYGVKAYKAVGIKDDLETIFGKRPFDKEDEIPVVE